MALSKNRESSITIWLRYFIFLFIVCLLEGCITSKDFGPATKFGDVSIDEVVTSLNINRRDILFSHTGFFERDHRPGYQYKGSLPSTLIITKNRLSIIIWSNKDNTYQLLWSNKIGDIDDFYVESHALVSGVTITVKPASDGVKEIVGFVVAEWTGFSDHKAAKNAENTFNEIKYKSKSIYD